MSDVPNPFAAMMAQMQEMAKTFPAMQDVDAKAFEDMWPKMPREMMEAMFGNSVNEGGLDARTRLLITLAGLVTQGAQNEMALRQTIGHAMEAGATAQQVSETIAMMSVFAGIPAVTKAMEVAQKVMKEDDET